MTRFIKLIFIVASLFLLSINVNGNTKSIIDLSNVEWNYKEFIYDDTIKTVELINVPKELQVKYSNNSFKEIGTYFAKATFIYDSNIYELKGYDKDKYESYCWTIVKGKYNISNIVFRDKTIVYDGQPHTLLANNIPEGVEVQYSQNELVEPGVYEITAKFIGNPYYLPIPDMDATLTINRKELFCDDGECKVISSLQGFNPTFHMKHLEIGKEEYQDVDLSKLGSYREVKSGFRLTIYNELDEVQTLDDNIVVEITLPKELIESDVLEVYEYSTSGISKIEININSSTINFEVSTLNADFLIVGMRETYSKGDNWKIGMIFIFIFVFLGSLYLIKKVNKKNKFK